MRIDKSITEHRTKLISEALSSNLENGLTMLELTVATGLRKEWCIPILINLRIKNEVRSVSKGKGSRWFAVHQNQKFMMVSSIWQLGEWALKGATLQMAPFSRCA